MNGLKYLPKSSRCVVSLCSAVMLVVIYSLCAFTEVVWLNCPQLLYSLEEIMTESKCLPARPAMPGCCSQGYTRPPQSSLNLLKENLLHWLHLLPGQKGCVVSSPDGHPVLQLPGREALHEPAVASCALRLIQQAAQLSSQSPACSIPALHVRAPDMLLSCFCAGSHFLLLSIEAPALTLELLDTVALEQHMQPAISKAISMLD